jgi:methylglutaconyl-CoA hydratase
LAYSACKNNTVLVEAQNGIVTLTLNRVSKNNAFNEAMIDELMKGLTLANRDPSCRALVIRGNGKNFCAGADLEWMQAAQNASAKANQEDAYKLSMLMATIDTFNKPVISLVQGSVYGGGIGLIACSDIVIGDRSAMFCLSETKLGLIPAVIGPYVISAIGLRQARRYMLTAEPFGIASALEFGLVHELHDVGKSDQALNDILRHIKQTAPLAVMEAKAFIRQYQVDVDPKATAQIIAKIRVGEEAKEGITAFLEGRKPQWCAVVEGA